MATSSTVRRTVRRIVGSPVASGRVPARLPMVFERHQALFESASVPPLPAPMLLVHTGGKPMAYHASGRHERQESIPGLVTFLPRNVRSEIALRGVGEGTVIYFDAPAGLPAWLTHHRLTQPLTFIDDVIVSITRRLMRELESEPADEPYLRTLGNALIAELRRCLEHPPSSSSTGASRGALRIAHTAIQHMMARLGDPLPVGDLARVCGVGVTSFSANFRRSTGLTPHRYLRRARIDRACELLRTTGLSVREVAEAVGFRGQGHFCTAFVAERGLTPSSYRRTFRDREVP